MTITDNASSGPELIPQGIQNKQELDAFFSQLKQLQQTKKGKINIVHIGDSHIQGDVMTGVCRTQLQEVFGNGGRGLVFPHTLAHTNGALDVRFSSNVKWNSYRNILPVNSSPVGLSGIALTTASKSLRLSLQIKDQNDFFTRIKVITPNNERLFDLAGEIEKKNIVKTVPLKKTHTIKKGETLSEIANQYQTTVARLKKDNRLTGTKITAGKTLKIASDKTVEKTVVSTVYNSNPFIEANSYHYYDFVKPMQKVVLLPNKEKKAVTLSGIVLENDAYGILYHNIGVNGAKFSDYTKYPMFFEQLKSLEPNLIIVSMGTNESYGKVNSLEYMKQVQAFLLHLKEQNPEASVLLITPPPSYLPHHKPNTFVDEYSKSLLSYAPLGKYAVWDLFQILGGIYGVNTNFNKGLMQPDRVHYTTKGYQMQGEMLTRALMEAYNDYKNKY